MSEVVNPSIVSRFFSRHKLLIWLLPILLLLLAITLENRDLWPSFYAQNGFTEGDISGIEGDIRRELATRIAKSNETLPMAHAKVKRVEMARKSNKELVGFAEVEMFGVTTSKPCSADYLLDGHSMWRCE